MDLWLWGKGVARLRSMEVGLRWNWRWLGVLTLELGRSVRLLRGNLVVVWIVVVGEMLLKIVVGVVGSMVVAPIQGKVGVDGV